ncbi:hypothetical protein DC498_23810 [Terrimonas sp.]|uniref:hypothetical protein n=1 Tax=Terrimonas sp. TaxID=1914338 RepID=UPI000D50D0D9|nr:hypothetical protein [Terrimonas sp.]PVD49709.1 hypothetical protein DC498_23810 [Terrimonas sp.]
MKKKLAIRFLVPFAVAFYCLNVTIVKCQVSTPQFIIPSANAYSLGKYGEIPVGTYSGVPDITIPLTSLSQNDVSVDINISYHGGGVKVDEIASWVGLGWSLNTGGVITRVVRGRPEYLLSNGEHYPIRRSLNFFSLPGDRTDYIASAELDALSGGSLDGEPDEFFFNFQGRSGRFWFNENGVAMLNKNEALEINWLYVSSYQSTFVIKDENGTTYEFAAIETAWYAEFNQNYPTAWHLTKITSANGNEINLEYYTPNSITQSIRYTSEYVASSIDIALYPTPVTTDFSLPQDEIFIKKISNRNGWIEFIRGTSQRLDYRTTSPSYALDEIRMFNKDSIPLKKFKFYTSYFEANNLRKYDGISPANYAHLNYRLRLDSIVEFATDFITQKPATQFFYLGDNNPATDDNYTLPYRLSPEQDHWGYYNKSGNSHIFPAPPVNNSNISSDLIYEYFMTEDCAGQTFSFSNGANRNPDTAAMKACTLNLIKYPTGGMVQYTFEANYYSGVFYYGGLRIKDIVNYSNADLPTQIKFAYGPGIATINPIEYYFTKYCILFTQNGPALGNTFLQNFGLPTTNPGGTNKTNFLKIRALPQAVLGNGTQFGYASVTVAQTGNGYSVYTFAEAGEFPDYTNNENLSESPKLGGLYGAQYITDWPSPELGPDGVDFYTSIRFTDYPGLPLYTNDWKRGVLKSKQDFNQNNILLRSETHQYTRTFLDTIAGVKVKKMTNLPDYIYAKYYVPHALIQKTKDSIVVFDQSGANPVTTTTEYFFDNAAHLQNTRVVTTNSKGEKESVYIKYPLDYTLTGTVTDATAQGVKLLQTNHLINPVVEKYTQRSNPNNSNLRTTSANLTAFKSNSPLPDKVYNWEPIPLPGSFTPTIITTTSVNKSGDYKTKVASLIFDTKGNLVEQQLQDNISECYIWDYSNTYPVAKVTGSSLGDIAYTSFEADSKGNWNNYTGVINTVTTTPFPPTGKKYYSLTSTATLSKTVTSGKTYIISYWRNSTSPYTANGGTQIKYEVGKTINGWTYHEHTVTATSSSLTITGTGGIDEVRLYPSTSQMTTYTYEPLIGMTSQCDANNKIIYYEYDSFGRLKTVRDQDRNVLKTMDYQYQQSNNQ